MKHRTSRKQPILSSVHLLTGSVALIVTSMVLPACSDDAGSGTDAAIADTITRDASESCQVTWSPSPVSPSGNCVRPTSDYNPGSSDDPYPSCISDDNTYHRFETNIGSIGRVAGFESIANLLLTGGAPSAAAFTDARVTYTEAEGLDSRVSRREDEHYPKATKKCADMTASEIEQNADRCVGQAQIQPLLNAAFRDGSLGKAPLLNAARIEAGLLWFLYVSVHKEATTCTDKKKDCDSSFAYYTGGEGRSGGLGLSRYIQSLSSDTHDRVWDGILAVRCWRDLDTAVPATDLAQRNQAIKQMDTSLINGLAEFIRSRVAAVQKAGCTEATAALWESARILGNVLNRAATERNQTVAASLRSEWAKTAENADTVKVLQLLANGFPCP